MVEYVGHVTTRELGEMLNSTITDANTRSDLAVFYVTELILDVGCCFIRFWSYFRANPDPIDILKIKNIRPSSVNCTHMSHDLPTT
jgi:hypothetical protein